MNNSKHLPGFWAYRLPRAKDAQRVRIRAVWFSLFVVAAVLTTSACRPAQNSNSPSPTTDTVVSAVPPFATKEPQRYQAVRTTTFNESSANGAPPVNETRSSSVLIARDGEKRREEFEVEGRGQIVYVESPAGRFVLLPASKLYADLNVATGGPDVQVPDELPGISADLLVNEAPAAAIYQRLGTEMVAGRQTTKYRVTSGMKAAGTDSTAETLIWIDETLGMSR